ncbi:phosphatidylserine decarboxylase family protein [Plebeiibacterium sediminum]|uniref:Phosphatidylserine decarboxylase proenzyme n=1 Tax=Plebeiibacterium sediminum TaxID=2992112 RepID=A0AAE3SDL5_9BACT|nr:phosphatidylserine decarboxylase family protein [Plebeiobacterium sediminum]MCW3784967.1 phosphatidylserine decarboxylase family protein [Plebeiobacterium sediminum]
MTIHKEGYKTILVAFIIAFAIIATCYFTIDNSIIRNSFYGVAAVLFIVIVNFFRSPERICKQINNAVITPADGEVVVIEEVDEPEYFKSKCKQVSIFMSPFNVHVNWFPVSGEVLYSKHHSGRFMGAYLPKSSTENERTSVVIKTDDGKEILVRQVAGAMARRIVCYAEEGMKAEQGAQMGFIKFGSRLDLYLPLDADIKVKIGDKVTGTQTTVAFI